MALKELVGIRVNDYTTLEFTEHTTDEGWHSGLSMSIRDGDGIHVFSFDDAHEAKTFAKRMLEQAERYTE